MKYIKSIFPYLFWIFLILFFNLFSIYKSFSFTNDSLYNLINKHKGYDTLKYYLDILESEVHHISDDLQKYILGEKEKLDTTVILSDESKISFYNDKASFHMKEVRDIIVNFRILSYIFISLSILFLILTKLTNTNFIQALQDIRNEYDKTFTEINFDSKKIPTLFKNNIEETYRQFLKHQNSNQAKI